MDWKEIGSLRELAEELSPSQIVQAAISIEETRSLEAEQTLLEFHGLNVSGLITTPFMYQIGVCARDAGWTGIGSFPPRRGLSSKMVPWRTFVPILHPNGGVTALFTR